jgi:glutamyl-Q tRNA(Asp) synthetase
VPVATNADGEKLSKQTGAGAAGPGDLGRALRFLGQGVPGDLTPRESLDWALRHWDAARIPRARAAAATF